MRRERYYRRYYSLNDAPAIMTLEETALLLKVAYGTAKARALKGELPGAFHFGKCWRVDKEVLIASLGTRRPTDYVESSNLESAIRELNSSIQSLINELPRLVASCSATQDNDE